MTDLDAIRERHTGQHWCDGNVGRAIYDPGTPCDAAALLAALGARTEEVEGLTNDLIDLNRQRAEALAREQALAEALRNIEQTSCCDDAASDARAALQQHEEALVTTSQVDKP